jgi:fimbrial chaperone protein
MPGLLSSFSAPARLLSGAAVLAGAFAAPAESASLQISPVMINLRATQTATGISLQNDGDVAIYGQVRVFLWDQKGGDDVLTPTDELIASPPVMQIAPKSTQTIRLVRRTGAAPGAERQYRVLIDEVPTTADTREGVSIKLQYSVPVFIAAAAPNVAPQLVWQFFKRDGAWFLRVSNSGTLHAQIGATTLETADGKQYELSKGLLGYALAGRQREWRLSIAPAVTLDGALAIRSNINTRPGTASGAVIAKPEPAR